MRPWRSPSLSVTACVLQSGELLRDDCGLHLLPNALPAIGLQCVLAAPPCSVVETVTLEVHEHKRVEREEVIPCSGRKKDFFAERESVRSVPKKLIIILFRKKQVLIYPPLVTLIHEHNSVKHEETILSNKRCWVHIGRTRAICICSYPIFVCPHAATFRTNGVWSSCSGSFLDPERRYPS